MREHQSFIGQSVGHHIILAVYVVHRPMHTALSKGVTEGDASSKVWPQIWRAASSLPAAKYDHFARENLGVQLENDPFINVCLAKRPLHAVLETNALSHVTGMLGAESTVVRSARRARPRHTNFPKMEQLKRLRGPPDCSLVAHHRSGRAQRVRSPSAGGGGQRGYEWEDGK